MNASQMNAIIKHKYKQQAIRMKHCENARARSQTLHPDIYEKSPIKEAEEASRLHVLVHSKLVDDFIQGNHLFVNHAKNESSDIDREARLYHSAASLLSNSIELAPERIKLDNKIYSNKLEDPEEKEESVEMVEGKRRLDIFNSVRNLKLEQLRLRSIIFDYEHESETIVGDLTNRRDEFDFDWEVTSRNRVAELATMIRFEKNRLDSITSLFNSSMDEIKTLYPYLDSTLDLKGYIP